MSVRPFVRLSGCLNDRPTDRLDCSRRIDYSWAPPTRCHSSLLAIGHASSGRRPPRTEARVSPVRSVQPVSSEWSSAIRMKFRAMQISSPVRAA